ncbi:DUF1345 domain-containing protein [Undibacterium sp.]|jgi:uncharacterized membrane protein|uniref:DUF1345 domain-containing protein n=1 Tax=Undibacterium sp. TaxID=1914977 RepID=UPI002B6B4BB6|nr:DUF1345 domain-containing protein [Undibacterium sp.]HTD05360.1 DUF1345 domain-containing protein [Undibacterium sp.]
MISIAQVAHNRPRLMFTFLLGLVIVFITPAGWAWVSRALVGWNVAVWSYLALVAWLMSCTNHESVRQIAEREDESAFAVLVILSTAATISLVAIIYELAQLKGLPADVRLMKYLFTGVTVLGSWCLLAIIFTLHYALLYYRSPEESRALRFPDDQVQPDYWDFLYFSFTIAVAVQTSDVAVMSRQMRKTVLAQSVLGFLFNTAILGFSINIAAGLVA